MRGTSIRHRCLPPTVGTPNVSTPLGEKLGSGSVSRRLPGFVFRSQTWLWQLWVKIFEFDHHFKHFLWKPGWSSFRCLIIGSAFNAQLLHLLLEHNGARIRLPRALRGCGSWLFALVAPHWRAVCWRCSTWKALWLWLMFFHAMFGASIRLRQ